jgi:hypothetical protein
MRDTVSLLKPRRGGEVKTEGLSKDEKPFAHTYPRGGVIDRNLVQNKQAAMKRNHDRRKAVKGPNKFPGDQAYIKRAPGKYTGPVKIIDRSKRSVTAQDKRKWPVNKIYRLSAQEKQNKNQRNPEESFKRGDVEWSYLMMVL